MVGREESAPAKRTSRTAAEAAVELCRDRDIAKVPGTTRVTSPGGNQLTSILLTSQPITKEKLDLVLDTGWIKKDELCQDVNPAIAPPLQVGQAPTRHGPARDDQF